VLEALSVEADQLATAEAALQSALRANNGNSINSNAAASANQANSSSSASSSSSSSASLSSTAAQRASIAALTADVDAAAECVARMHERLVASHDGASDSGACARACIGVYAWQTGHRASAVHRKFALVQCAHSVSLTSNYLLSPCYARDSFGRKIQRRGSPTFNSCSRGDWSNAPNWSTGAFHCLSLRCRSWCCLVESGIRVPIDPLPHSHFPISISFAISLQLDDAQARHEDSVGLGRVRCQVRSDEIRPLLIWRADWRLSKVSDNTFLTFTAK
jgi:hypothetical protein